MPTDSSHVAAGEVARPPQPPIVEIPRIDPKAMLALQKDLGLNPQAHLDFKDPKDVKTVNLVNGPVSEVVFLSIDLEAYEFAQTKITEIGISTFDTRQTSDAHPSTWTTLIKTRHLRIKEHKNLVNKKWIQGCPDAFNFGTSEFIALRQIRNELTSIFNNPAGAAVPTTDKRKIVLVGHGLKNDTDYLKSLGFSPNVGGNIVRNLDTQTICGSTKRKTIGLERLLRGLGEDPVNLHNAGNDAHYTLQALVMMAVQHTERPGSFLQRIQDVEIPETFKQKARREAAARRADALAKINAQRALEGLPSQADMRSLSPALKGTRPLQRPGQRPGGCTAKQSFHYVDKPLMKSFFEQPRIKGVSPEGSNMGQGQAKTEAQNVSGLSQANWRDAFPTLGEAQTAQKPCHTSTHKVKRSKNSTPH